MQCHYKQYHAAPCNTMPYPTITCSNLQYHVVQFITMQYQLISGITIIMHYNAIPCKTRQNRIKCIVPCITMQYLEILSNSMHYHALSYKSMLINAILSSIPVQLFLLQLNCIQVFRLLAGCRIVGSQSAGGTMHDVWLLDVSQLDFDDTKVSKCNQFMYFVCRISFLEFCILYFVFGILYFVICNLDVVFCILYFGYCNLYIV